MKHLEVVLITLKDNQLYAKYSKYEFGLMKIEYLGHTVSVEAVQMEKSKVKATVQ